MKNGVCSVGDLDSLLFVSWKFLQLFYYYSMEFAAERRTSLDPCQIQESKSSILMAKVQELFAKLAQQISENEILADQNSALKQRVSELENQQSSCDSSTIFGGRSNPLFNLFIEKIASLENENKKLKQQKEKLSQPSFQSQGQALRRPPSITQKYMSPNGSSSYLSNQDENFQSPSNCCFSPRTSKVFKQASTRNSCEIDKLWLSPSRKNLQKIINSHKNR